MKNILHDWDLVDKKQLIEFGDVFDYTCADFYEWRSEAGFKSFELSI